jgi:hypothetical protein
VLLIEVRYIQRRAADYDSRIVTIGQLILFSTKTGDAWRLDPADQSAARLAREGNSESIQIEKTDTTSARRKLLPSTIRLPGSD